MEELINNWKVILKQSLYDRVISVRKDLLNQGYSHPERAITKLSKDPEFATLYSFSVKQHSKESKYSELISNWKGMLGSEVLSGKCTIHAKLIELGIVSKAYQYQRLLRILLKDLEFKEFYESTPQYYIRTDAVITLSKFKCDWKSILGPDVLAHRLSVHKRLATLGVNKYQIQELIKGMKGDPEFQAFYSFREQFMFTTFDSEVFTSKREQIVYHLARYGIKDAVPFPSSLNSGIMYSGLCSGCGRWFDFHFIKQGTQEPTKCPWCSSSSTKFEAYLFDLLSKHTFVKPHYLKNDKTSFLKGQEIDLFLPEYSIGIEVNGAYSHNSAIHPCIPAPRSNRVLTPTDPYSHYNKSFLCKQNGINLLHVPDHPSQHYLVSQVLLAKLGIFNSSLSAGSCKLEEISQEAAELFYSGNHLHGFSKSSVHVALLNKGVVVYCVSFTRHQNNVWVLARCASLAGMKVSYAFSKCLGYFIKTYVPLSIETFAYRDLSPDLSDNVYIRHGFSFVCSTKRSLYYYKFKGNKLVNRQSYMKHKLFRFNGAPCINQTPTPFYPASEIGAPFIFNPQLTEQQNLYKLHIHPYYDSGTHKYVLTL